MAGVTRVILCASLVAIVVVAPIIHYRDVYTHDKRLRVVIPGKLYRSGQLTAAGFKEAFERFHIKTVLNVQEDFPDPDLPLHYWTGRTVKESVLCGERGVHYLNLKPDLIPRRESPERHPAVIDEMLAILDDEANYPVLIHCKAGLHRTGILTAVCRMEYEGWTPAEAFREAKAQGVGNWTSANDYVAQYILSYRPRRERSSSAKSDARAE
jgi:protein tyrosine phosphatase (PTP) superfamily phosphohydrolase (DUF442 family)